MTQDISKDIISVLMNEDQLGIGGLGTFTLHRQAAIVSPFEGKVSPPSKNVGFNPNLKMDDGKLSRYLRDTYRLSPEEAQARIAAFVDSLSAQLAAGNVVHLGELGRFSRDPKGNLRFDSGKQNFDKSVFGLSPVILTPISRAERVAVPPAATVAAPVITSTKSSIPPVTPIAEHAKEDTMAIIWLFLRDNIWYIAAGSALLFVLGLWYLSQREEQPRLPDDLRVNTSPVPITEPKDRVNVSPSPNPEEVETPLTIDDDDESGFQSPSEAITSTPREELDQPTPPVNVAPPSRQNTAIIAVGRFGRQANVEKTKRRITAAGYTPYTKKENGLTRVGVQVDYLSADQLDRALADIRRRFTQDAFIIKR